MRLRQRGFTLLAVMVALALLAVSSTGVVFVLSQQAQREREAELLRVGEAYVRAIASFHDSSPGSVKTWPRDLADLLEDSRYLTIRRHLRSAYADPVSGQPMLLIRRADGTIEGVRSPSLGVPLRTAAIELDRIRLDAAARYADWRFVFVPPPAEAPR